MASCRTAMKAPEKRSGPPMRSMAWSCPRTSSISGSVETGDLQYTISGKDDVIENIRSRLSQGEAPVTIMEEVMGESLDLTGCTTEELLYVINQDRPVIAMLDAQNAVILVGYTDASVIYVNVSSGERSSVSYTEMDQMTAGSGSTYIG